MKTRITCPLSSLFLLTLTSVVSFSQVNPPVVKTVALLGMEEEVKQALASSDVGYNGVSENKKGKLTNVTIGGISVDAPEVVFFGKGTGRDKKPWGINIGNVFLKDFVVTIDYRRKLVTLERP